MSVTRLGPHDTCENDSRGLLVHDETVEHYTAEWRATEYTAEVTSADGTKRPIRFRGGRFHVTRVPGIRVV